MVSDSTLQELERKVFLGFVRVIHMCAYIYIYIHGGDLNFNGQLLEKLIADT